MDVQPAPTATAVPPGAVQTPPQVPGATPDAPQLQASPSAAGDGRGALSDVAASLFSKGPLLQPLTVNVTFRVESGTIVTVFTDPSTGKEISQVPAELLVQLAQFFDKHSGVALDKSA